MYMIWSCFHRHGLGHGGSLLCHYQSMQPSGQPTRNALPWFVSPIQHTLDGNTATEEPPGRAHRSCPTHVSSHSGRSTKMYTVFFSSHSRSGASNDVSSAFHRLLAQIILVLWHHMRYKFMFVCEDPRDTTSILLWKSFFTDSTVVALISSNKTTSW